MKNRFLPSLALLIAALFLANCAKEPEITLGPNGKPVDKDGKPFNPYEPGTYDHFKAEHDYPKTSKIWKNDQLLPSTGPHNSRLVFKKDIQRGFLMNGDEVVIDYPISTGTRNFPTPTGTFRILEKTVNKKSNTYGTVYDADGGRVYGKEKYTDVPEGGSFSGAPMPYWMRLTKDGVGHHIGNVPRYPASHGCIRGPRAVVPMVYKKVKVGTEVVVE